MVSNFSRAITTRLGRIFLRILVTITTFFVILLPSHNEPVYAAARQNYYAESTTQSTWNTDTTYQDKTTLTFTPDANSTYVIIASWLVLCNNVTYAVYSKLTRTTGTAKDFNELIYFPKDTTDYIAGGAVAFDSFGSSPTSQTYKIQYRPSNTAATASIKEAKIIAIKLNEEDKYAEVDARTTTQQTAYQDKVTLNFTPTYQGDYIILAYATGDGAINSYDFRIQMNIDGTAYSNYNIEPVNAANRYLFGTVKKVNFDATSHTIKIQYSTESNNSARVAGIANARILALRADYFNNSYFAESEALSTTTSTTYSSKTTLTETPLAVDHLIIGASGIAGNSASYSTYTQLLKNTTSYGEMLIETKDTLNYGYPYFVIKKETLANTSTSWYLQYKSENAAATAWIRDSRIAVIELEEPSFVITANTAGTQITNLHQGESNAHIGGAFTFTRNLTSTSVTSITISETGTISDSNISGLIIYYKQEATCSTTIPGDATQFNSTPGSFSSGSSTVTGSMTVGTSQICVYIEVDIGSGAGVGDTVEIQITNPSTQVTASSGTVSPATAVAISGTTTIISAGALAVDIVDGSDQTVSSPSVSFSNTFFSWVGAQTTGTLGTSTQKIKVTNTTTTHTWTLSIAATSGESALWQDSPNSYDYNGTQSAGRLRVNPSSVTITPGGACSNTGISGQSAQYFVSGSVSSINLVIASASAEHNCYWYITAVGLTQDIPAEQPTGTYSLGMTITVI